MAVITIREKNQVTIPQRYLTTAKIAVGDPVEFMGLPDGGIAIYRYGHNSRRQSLWEVANRIAAGVPGIEQVDLQLPSREVDAREVAW